VDVKSIDLFQAHSEGKVALEGGYIVSSFFQDSSSYAKFEVVAYKAVKSLSPSEEGLTFQCDANKLFVLVEPADYERRDAEPFARDSQHQVPHRFSELEQITAANMTRIMLSRQPVSVYAAFTVAKPTPLSSSLLFYNLPDVLDSIAAYFERILIARAGVPPFDAAEAARRIVAAVRRFTIWQEVVERVFAPQPAPAEVPEAPPAAPKAPQAPPIAAKAPAGMPTGMPIRRPAEKPAVQQPAPPKAPAAAPAPKPAAKIPAAKKAPAKKPAAKPAVKKAAARKPPAKKAPARKPAARAAAARRPAARKAAAKTAAKKPAGKRAAKKSPARKPAVKKAPARKAAAKKPAARKPARRK
jgi:hypothetical protein